MPPIWLDLFSRQTPLSFVDEESRMLEEVFVDQHTLATWPFSCLRTSQEV
jgi:hypothetical protein